MDSRPLAGDGANTARSYTIWPWDPAMRTDSSDLGIITDSSDLAMISASSDLVVQLQLICLKKRQLAHCESGKKI